MPITLPALARLLQWALVLVGLLVVVVTFTPLDRWCAERLAGGWSDPPGDVLIVLGGAQPTGDDIIANSTYLRSAYAVRAWRKHNFPAIVVSGGGSPATVAASMRDFMQSQGVPLSIIRLEDRSRTTRENALYTAELVRAIPGKKVLLTSDYHMYRALRVFRKAGVDAEPRPIPDVFKRSGSWLERWPAFLDVVREMLKIGYYKARGWM